MRRRLTRHARRAAAVLRGAAVRVGLARYQPETRPVTTWDAAYADGQLEYYGGIEELGRYSIIGGYVGWFAATAGSRVSVLDVGCGTGLLRERLGNAGVDRYVGVDVSEQAIDAARRRGGGDERTKWVVGDVTDTRLAVEPADVVIVNEVLYYAPDPVAFLRRIGSLVRPGGIVLLSIWRHRGDAALWRVVERELEVVDLVEVRNPANAVNPRGWFVACCRPPSVSRGS